MVLSSEHGNEKDDIRREHLLASSSENSASHPQSSSESGDVSDLWNVPPFTSPFPAIGEATMQVVKTASYFSRCFTELVEEAVSGESGEMSMESIGQLNGSDLIQATPDLVPPQIEEVVSGESGEMSMESIDQLNGSGLSQATPDLVPPQIGSEIPQVSSTRNASGQSSPDMDALITSPMNSLTSIINATGSAMFGIGQSFLSSPPHALLQGIKDRIEITLRGSADDIGWLQRMPGVAPVEDMTNRFTQILELIRKGVHTLPNNVVYLLVPGLFSNHGPLYFVDTKKYFSKLGLTCHIARIHSEAAVETNALVLKNDIGELYWGSGKRVVILGHSKGGVDAAAAISMYWSDLKDKVAGLAFAQSPYGGSPIAADILRKGQIADLETRRILEVLICKVLKGDIRALEDLTYEKRQEFLARYPLPLELPTVSFHTEASIGPSVFSTMSHIAHAEIPWLRLPVSNMAAEAATAVATSELPKVPVFFPLAAAMAACALHLQVRYKEKSDGLVTRKDAEVPGSAVVRPSRKLDHGWMVYSPSWTDSNEPNSPQICEALLTLLLQVKMKETNQSYGLQTLLQP